MFRLTPIALFVCAAGNSRKNLDDPEDLDYPSCYGVPNQLVVGASDNRDASSSFSNYGSVVDLTAPGQAMFSLMPGSKYRDGKQVVSFYQQLLQRMEAIPGVTE